MFVGGSDIDGCIFEVVFIDGGGDGINYWYCMNIIGLVCVEIIWLRLSNYMVKCL